MVNIDPNLQINRKNMIANYNAFKIHKRAQLQYSVIYKNINLLDLIVRISELDYVIPDKAVNTWFDPVFLRTITCFIYPVPSRYCPRCDIVWL